MEASVEQHKIEGTMIIEVNKIAEALSLAQSEFPAVTFDAKVKVRTKAGGEYEFQYATLPHILELTRQALAKNYLAVTQVFENDVLITRLLHASGQYLESRIQLPLGADMTNQEIGSVITYFRRYSIVSILGVCGEEDDDANLGDGNQMEKGSKQPQTPPPKPQNGVKNVSKAPVKGKMATPQPIVPEKPQEPLTKLPAAPRPDLSNMKPPKAGGNKGPTIMDVSQAGITPAKTPYGLPNSGSPVISAEKVANIIAAFKKFDVSSDFLEMFSGFPVEQWTEDMKTYALADWHKLDEGMKKEDIFTN